MKKSSLLLLILLCCLGLKGQEIGLNFNYQLIDAKEWSKATQVYNFSRPFLEKKQPQLNQGFSIGLYYIIKPLGKISWGPSLSFSIFRSSSENPNYNIDINSLLLDLGAKIQYRPGIADNNNLHLSFTPNLTLVTLNRKLNGEIAIMGQTEEDQPLRSLGLGLGLKTQIVYDLTINNNWQLSPTIGLNYYPYIWAERSEVIFNESAAGDLRSNTSIFGVESGIVLKFQGKN